MAKDRAIETEERVLPKIEEVIKESVKAPIYKVKVIHPRLRIRTMPSLSGDVVDHITNQGIYAIFAEQDGWGQLEDDNWIMLNYTQKVK